MKIRVIFHDEKISWDKKWIFLGSSYKNLKTAEKKISGSRLKINSTLHEVFKKELQDYLEWTENQRKYFNDSIFWWMTSLAGRNNLSSNFLLFICQVKALKKILENTEESELLIVSDDVLLIENLILNLKDYKIIKSNLFFLKKFRNFILHYYRVSRSLIACFLDLILTFFYLKITSKNKNLPTGKAYLLHQHTDINSLRKNSKLKSRYFPYLKEYFKKENLKLYTLTWYSFFLINKLKAIKNIRSEDHFIPEDWLNLFDYINSFKNYFKISSYFSDKVNYPNFDVGYLMLIEKRTHLEQINSNLRFCMYPYALKKWAKNLNKLSCIDHYENMVYEHALIGAAKNLEIETKLYGYHHTLSSYEFTAWHSLELEWESKFKPDYVISLGSISNKLLEDQGIPAKKIISGPALRYSNILETTKDKSFKSEKNILIPLSQIRDASYEMFNSILSLSKNLNKTNYNFFIKPHPNLEISKFLNSSELSQIPKNLIISNEDIDTLMDKCLITIFMSTAAAYNAVLNGNIVFNLRSELNFSDNYLDILEKDFKFVNSYSLDSIKQILLDFENNEKKIEEYKDEFKKIRQYFVSGFNQVNEVNLAKFK